MREHVVVKTTKKHELCTTVKKQSDAHPDGATVDRHDNGLGIVDELPPGSAVKQHYQSRQTKNIHQDADGRATVGHVGVLSSRRVLQVSTAAKQIARSREHEHLDVFVVFG